MRAALFIALFAAACSDSLTSLPPDDGSAQQCAGTVDACTGAACSPCPATPVNAQPMQCVQRACVYECQPGWLRCASGCCEASAIAAGGDTTCAIVDGAVRCWGSNAHAQLGFTGAASSVPVQIAGISGATKLAVGASHACAVAGGQVLCWGANDAGQLGTAPGADSPTPVVAATSDVASIAAGQRHTCIASVAGQLTCWGADDSGQRDAPAVSAASVAAGLAYSCAVVSGGAVQCWGALSGTPIASATTALAGGAGHVCAIASNNVECWGAGASGQLGNGTSDSATPLRVNGLSNPTGVLGAGGAHSCAVVEAGGSGTNLMCWGSNASGQLGLGVADGVHAQATSVSLAGVTQLALGTSHSCALIAGAVRCWGANDQGQAGTGTTDAQVLSPALVSGR